MKNILAALRKKNGITQEELAAAMKVTRQTIISIEAGRFNPSVVLAIKISRFFNMRVDEIFMLEEEEEQ